jgi:hypothetical protein
LQWLQEPSEINDLYNLKRETNRKFRKKMREYLKEKIDELATNSKNKNITYHYRIIYEFKRGHQPRNILKRDETDDLLGDSHNILNT